MLAEKFVVTVDELSLTYGRKQLALVYTIELFSVDALHCARKQQLLKKSE